eukprot:COSAG02_NODE_4450_length_5344_cov_34.750048_4_plen_97_part_00
MVTEPDGCMKCFCPLCEVYKYEDVCGSGSGCGPFIATYCACACFCGAGCLYTQFCWNPKRTDGYGGTALGPTVRPQISQPSSRLTARLVPTTQACN